MALIAGFLLPPSRLLSSINAQSPSSSNPSEHAGSSSYLSMWRRAKERQQQEQLRLYNAEEKETEKEKHRNWQGEYAHARRNGEAERSEQEGGAGGEDWEAKSKRFESILKVPPEERDKVQRLQIIDRAAAALAAVNALLREQESTFRNSAATLPPLYAQSISQYTVSRNKDQGDHPDNTSTTNPTLGALATPGPDFWSWTPPDKNTDEMSRISENLYPNLLPDRSSVLLEKDDFAPSLNIPFESMESGLSVFQSRAKPSLPPLQSLVQVQENAVRTSEEIETLASSVTIPDIATQISSVMHQESKNSTINSGVNRDGSSWWKETGKDLRKDGVTCSWTVIRGVNADGTEWEEKFWEAFDEFDYKELGAEKSGRDASGNIWREFWKEAMWQDLSSGLLHIEKNADKWGKNGYGTEWHEKWREYYNASGRAEKSTEKWCKIDEATPLEPGHAHIWHERWGEEFDGLGGAMKYTDKWAERSEFCGGRSKWGDKWDEKFDMHSHGVKRGETWWEGAGGERWNRTWGEEHAGTGWVHKYGKSSSGEHWDTHEQQETWYERYPHYGFHHCLDNSGELQRVGKTSHSIKRK